MTWLRRHPPVVLAGVAVFILAAVFVVALARSRSAGCALAPPVPDLPSQLRVLGDFDQPYDVSQPRVLQDAASRVATALHRDLGATEVGDPVPVRALAPDHHDALVVPLSLAPVAGGGPGPVVGLVAFLRDCSGRAYYSAVEDLGRSSAPGQLATAFPALPRGDATRRLAAADIELVYGASPFTPSWRDVRSGQTIPAASTAAGG
jgi:hypothetical protein